MFTFHNNFTSANICVCKLWWQANAGISLVTESEYVMRSVKTSRMLQNAKFIFWSHFKAKSELFPELLKLCLYDIHIQSYN